MDILAKDGDTGNPRPILITIEGDSLGYFNLVSTKGSGEAKLITSFIPLDREHPSVLQNGGVYSFFVKVCVYITYACTFFLYRILIILYLFSGY